MRTATKASLALGAIAVGATASMATAGATTGTFGGYPGFYCDYSFTVWGTQRSSDGNNIDVSVGSAQHIYVCGQDYGAMVLYPASCQTNLAQGSQIGIKDPSQTGAPAWGSASTMTKSEPCWKYATRQASGASGGGLGGSFSLTHTFK